MNRVRIFFRLIKFPIVLLSTLSASAGFFLVRPVLSMDLLFFNISLLALAAGSAALNQVQDRTYDAVMERTRNRPLPSGDLSLRPAVTLSLILITAGSVSLFFYFGPEPFIIGIITVGLYNGVYTYLKRRSPYAVFPGAVIGALPPAIGWSAAGGNFLSVQLLGIMFFFYLWQVPHFWLLLGIHSEEYSRAGYPVITSKFSHNTFSRIVFIWISIALSAGVLVVFSALHPHTVSIVVITLAALFVLFRSLPLLNRGNETAGRYRPPFRMINLFALCVILILMFERGIFS
jgi:protoheme IX farnesyltransferase